jgi:hypothetical protein
MEFLTAFLGGDFLGKPAWLWLLFLAIVGALLAFDLGVLNKQDKELGRRRKPEAVGVLHRGGDGIRRLAVVVHGP